MSIKYGDLYVDEKYSSILEPNLFYNTPFVPGTSYTDKYETGPAGQIYVHKLATSAVEPGAPGRDFTDEASEDELIPIALNNNFQKSKKIYGVQANAVDIALANEQLSIATNEVKEGRQQSGLACLVNEGTAVTGSAITEGAKNEVIDVRTALVGGKGNADTLMVSPAFYGLILKESGSEFTPSTNDEIAKTGVVGKWLGFNVIEAGGLFATSAKYIDSTGTTQTVSFAGVEFILYHHEALSIVDNLEAMRIVDSENFVGSKAQVEMNTGFKVTNADLVMVRKTTASV